MPAQVLPVSPRCSFMLWANERLIRCLFHTGQGIVQMNERWMDRARRSLRRTGGGPAPGTTTNTDETVEISERVWTRWQPAFLWNATLDLQILIYVSPQLHRLQQKHCKLHDIWPQTSQGGDFCQQNSFQTFFSLLHFTFKQVTFFSCGSNISLEAKSEDSDQSFASPSRFRNTAFSFLHGRGCHVLADDIWYHSSLLIELLRLTLTVSGGGRTFEKPGRHLSSVTRRRALHVIKLLLAEASLLEDKNVNSRQRTISVKVWHT